MIVLFFTYHFSDIGPKKRFSCDQRSSHLFYCSVLCYVLFLVVLKTDENIRNKSFYTTQAVGDLWMGTA